MWFIVSSAISLFVLPVDEVVGPEDVDGGDVPKVHEAPRQRGVPVGGVRDG